MRTGCGNPAHQAESTVCLSYGHVSLVMKSTGQAVSFARGPGGGRGSQSRLVPLEGEVGTGRGMSHTASEGSIHEVGSGERTVLGAAAACGIF